MKNNLEGKKMFKRLLISNFSNDIKEKMIEEKANKRQSFTTQINNAMKFWFESNKFDSEIAEK